MEVNKSTIAAAKAALWSREARWALFDPNVLMIDFGHPDEAGQVNYDAVAIRFHVRQKWAPLELEMAAEGGQTRGPLPRTLGGFTTDVQENKLQLNVWPWRTPQPPVARRNGRVTPLQGGISVSDEFRQISGTLGGIVFDRNSGNPMILSNWHVLAAGWYANPRHRVYQPGRSDGGTDANTIATFARHGMFQRIDAAVAALTPGGREYLNQQFELPNSVAKGVSTPSLGMRLIKSGRTSGVTHGIVDTITSGSFWMDYQGVKQIIEPAFVIKPVGAGQSVSAPGDSGSIWFEESTMRAIGLHFAGSNNPETAVAIEMPSVLNALGVNLLS
jgi:endonuclease G